MAQPNETPEYLFFVKNQFMLRIEHERNQFADGAKVSRIVSFFESKALRSYLPPVIDGDAVGISFNLLQDGQESSRQLTLFPIRPPNLRTTNEAQAETPPPDIDVWSYITNFQALLSQGNVPLQGDGEPPILLQAAIPNWYLGGSTHLGLGTGGSGRRPRPVANQKLNTLGFVFDPEFKQGLSETVNWDRVSVYIIDTLPPQARIEDAWNTWGGDPTKLERFQSILQPRTSPRADVYTTDRADYYYADPNIFNDTLITEPPNPPHAVILRDHCADGSQDEPNKHHNYDMSDHGLFIAGIFNSIVPEVKISAIQALNGYGVGTFESIALGFKRVSQLHTDPHQLAIINCSFTLAYPRNVENPPDGDNQPNPCTLPLPSSQYPENQQISDLAIQATADLFAEVAKNISTNSKIFAAAGNDSQRDAKTPEAKGNAARQLASTPLSIGVGALKSDLKTPASYSNEADAQPNEGFVVFGGDYNDPTFTGTDEGVISIFTGNLNIDITPDAEGYHASWDKVTPTIYDPGLVKIVPVPTSNDNGYAEWAGTSFATPILAASIAFACGHGLSISEAVDHVKSKSENPNGPAPWKLKRVWQVHS